MEESVYKPAIIEKPPTITSEPIIYEPVIIASEPVITSEAVVTEVPVEKLSTELTWNVVEGPTQKVLNQKPLTEDEAHSLARQLHEGNPARSLNIRSNRAILQE